MQQTKPTMTVASTAAPSPAPTPAAPSAPAPRPRRRRGEQEAAPEAAAAPLPPAPALNDTPRSRGGSRGAERTSMASLHQERIPSRLGSAGADEDGGYRAGSSSTSRRVVRGKVSVTEDRPNTGESIASNQQAPPVKDTRPLWLQSDASKPVHRSRPPLDPDGATPRALGVGSRARPDSRMASEERGLDLEFREGGAEDDRKNKRLQQEIQRLTRRLAESDMYSAEDDGLPRFALQDVEEGLMIAQGGFASVHHATWHCTPCA